MPNSAGVEVARISVKVSPDTRDFRRDLKKQLEKEEKSANADKPEVGVGANTKKLKSDVSKATTGLKARVDVEAKQGSLDRFQRRTGSELQAGMNKLEAKINLDRAGEQFRRDIEKASAALEKLIKSPIPKNVGEASARRLKIREEINALMELGAENPKANSNWLGVSDRQFQNIQRLANIRRIAADNEIKAEKQRHTAQLASWKDELNHIKIREDETRKFLTQHKKDNPPFEVKLDPNFDYKLRKNLSKIKPKVDVEPVVSRRSSLLSGLGDIPGKLAGLMPSFGGGINPMGYIVILGAAIALAAPLIGLLSTAILAIPGLIAAVATPFAAIALGMDGIKKAAETAGLTTTDADGKTKIGPFLDKVKADVSKAFEDGLTPSFTKLKDSANELLGSMPKVATGITDLFKGFTDALTSGPGKALFDETVSNIGAAMSQAAPGVQSFTNGLLRITTAFSQELPGLSTWFNKTADSFDKWVQTMTTVDPTTGTTPMSESFEGLGNTLKTIGEFIVNLAKEGMEFIKDPAKMDGFITTLKNVGSAIEALVALGNKLGPAWQFISGANPTGAAPPMGGDPNYKPGVNDGVGAQTTTEAVKEGNKHQGEAQAEQKGFWGSALDILKSIGGANGDIGQGGVQQLGPSGAVIHSPQELAEDYRKQSASLQEQIAALQKSADSSIEFHGGRMTDQAQGYIDDLNGMKKEFEDLKKKADEAKISLQTPPPKPAAPPPPPSDGGKAVLDDLKGQMAATPPIKAPEVDLKSFETSMAQMPQIVGSKGDESAAKAGEIPGKIQAAFGDMTGIGQTAGSQVAAGFIAGLQGGIPGVEAAAKSLAAAAKTAANKELGIKSPSREFMKIGDFTGQGFAIGLENGFQPVLDKAKDMAGRVADAYAAGNVDPSGVIDGLSKEEIKNMNKVLGIEQKRLEMQAKALQYKGDKEGAKNLRAKKDELGLQKDMLDLTQDLNDETSSAGEDPFAKAAAGLAAAPVNFAKATGQQFMSDIGIGGNGLISKAITEGISYVFQINSVDEALSIKDRTESKQAMTVTGGR